MPVAKTTSEGLTQTLAVTVTKDLYLPEWKKQLSKTQKSAQMKGFRKGKTPMGFVKKMYGQSLLGEAVNAKIHEELNTFLKENNLNILGQPIASADQEHIDIDSKNPQDYTFKFDIGLAPEIELVDLSQIAVNRDVVEISEEMLLEELEASRKRAGKQEDVDEADEDDIVKLQARELDASGAIKAEGHEVEISVLISTLNDDAKPSFKGGKLNDEIKFNIYNLEKDSTREHVVKHLLQLSEDVAPDSIGEEFTGTITEIKRNVPAELNEDFFKQLFNDDSITDEAGAKEKFKEEIGKYFIGQANNLMHHEIRAELLNAHKIELPKLFIERWLKTSKAESTQAHLDHEYIHIAEDLTWSIIQGEIVKKNNIEIKQEDIRAGFMDQISSYFGGQMAIDPEMFKGTIDKMMENKEQVQTMYDQTLSKRVFDTLMDQVSITESSISVDDFKAKVTNFNQSLQQHNH